MNISRVIEFLINAFININIFIYSRQQFQILILTKLLLFFFLYCDRMQEASHQENETPMDFERPLHYRRNGLGLKFY